MDDEIRERGSVQGKRPCADTGQRDHAGNPPEGRAGSDTEGPSTHSYEELLELLCEYHAIATSEKWYESGWRRVREAWERAQEAVSVPCPTCQGKNVRLWRNASPVRWYCRDCDDTYLLDKVTDGHN